MKITDNVFALNATNGSYSYVIMGKDIILIDSGRPDQRSRILKELKSMDIGMKDIRHILLTHHDIDHIGNAAFLQKESDCNVWASEQDLPYIRGEMKRPGIKRVIESIVRAGVPGNLNAYRENEVIEEIEVIPTPGHTPGHVCLLYKDILFAGDIVHISKGRLEPYPSFWNWDTSMLMTSINKIASAPFKWICPAHGRPIERNDDTFKFLF